MIYEECCSPKFFNIFNWKNILNTYFIEEVLRGKTNKRLDVDKIFSSTTELYVGVNNFDSAKPELIKTKDKNELLTALRASISVPALVSDEIRLNEQRYVDGFMSNPHVITKALQTIPATHVLILTNQDQNLFNIPLYEKLLNYTLFRKRFSHNLLLSTNKRGENREVLFSKLKNGINNKSICIVWGDKSIGSLERNPNKAKRVIQKSSDWWRTLLSN